MRGGNDFLFAPLGTRTHLTSGRSTLWLLASRWIERRYSESKQYSVFPSLVSSLQHHKERHQSLAEWQQKRTERRCFSPSPRADSCLVAKRLEAGRAANGLANGLANARCGMI